MPPKWVALLWSNRTDSVILDRAGKVCVLRKIFPVCRIFLVFGLQRVDTLDQSGKYYLAYGICFQFKMICSRASKGEIMAKSTFFAIAVVVLSAHAAAWAQGPGYALQGPYGQPAGPWSGGPNGGPGMVPAAYQQAMMQPGMMQGGPMQPGMMQGPMQQDAGAAADGRSRPTFGDPCTWRAARAFRNSEAVWRFPVYPPAEM